MTDAELDAISADYAPWADVQTHTLRQVADDIAKLVAEVKRLKALVAQHNPK